jgi:hypothetical protein
VRTGAYYWAADDAVLVSTVRAVANQLGNPGGVVNIDVSLKGLTEIVKQIKLGESGYLMLMENNGNVMVDPATPATTSSSWPASATVTPSWPRPAKAWSRSSSTASATWPTSTPTSNWAGPSSA